MHTVESFQASLASDAPPSGLTRPLRALWHAARGEWDRAHGLVQEDEADPACAWVHAHLHRVEGDLGNARYWYRRAGRPEARSDHAAERRVILVALAAGGGAAP
jgi:hypothetical protein